MKKITLNNIKQYLEGNINLALEGLKLQPQHIQEQVGYRRLICKDDCAVQKKCIYCGCDFYGKTQVTKSCNDGKRFPNIMGEKEWEKYKEQNNIK